MGPYRGKKEGHMHFNPSRSYAMATSKKQASGAAEAMKVGGCITLQDMQSQPAVSLSSLTGCSNTTE